MTENTHQKPKDLFEPAVNTADTDESPPQATCKDVEWKGNMLKHIFSQVLGISVADCTDDRSLDSLGGDALAAVQIVRALAEKGIHANTDDILRRPIKFNMMVKERQPLVKPSQAAKLKDEINIPYPLSSAQQFYINHQGQDCSITESVYLRTTSPVSEAVASRALGLLVKQHSALRLRFYRQPSGEHFQVVTSDVDNSYRVCFHDECDTLDGIASLASAAAPFDIEKGPVVVLHSIEQSGSQLLYLRAHPLVADAMSWHVILPTLDQLLQDKELFEANRSGSASYQQWARQLAKTKRKTAEPNTKLRAEGLNRDTAQTGVIKGFANSNVLPGSCIGKLSVENTHQLLRNGQRVLRTDATDLLLAALFQCVTKHQRVWVENHGRDTGIEDLSVAGTVGRFALFQPIELPQELFDSVDVLEILRTIKDFRRKVHEGSVSLQQERIENFRTICNIGDVTFQWLSLDLNRSQSLSLLQQLPPSSSWSHSVPTAPQARLQLCAWLEGGQLHFRCFHADSQVEAESMVERLQGALQALNKALETRTSEWTAADFPLFKGSSGDLRRLMSRLGTVLQLSDVRDVEDLLSCSPVQKGMLMAELRDSMQYITRWMWEVKAPAGQTLDIKRLEVAWQSVVQRHTALRTMILADAEKGRFYQLTMKRTIARVTFPSSQPLLGNLQPLSPPAQLTPSDIFLSTHHLAIFPISKDGTSCFVQLDIHHAFIDGSSRAIIEKDFVEAYGQETSASLAPASPYSLYVAEAENRSVSNQASLAFWKEHINKSGSQIETCCIKRLPCSSDKDSERGKESAQQLRPAGIVVNTELQEPARVREFCMRYEVTIADLFQVAWGLMLRLYVGTSSPYWGCPVSDRDTQITGIHDMVGVFLNCLVCRLDAVDSDSVVEVLHRFQKDQQQRMQHATCPLED
ncbi:hypothetical protein COCSADRAFT_165904, partial [Bipolaris sorokiniana ND90Pr]